MNRSRNALVLMLAFLLLGSLSAAAAELVVQNLATGAFEINAVGSLNY